MTSRPPPHLRPARLRRRVHGVQTLLDSTAQRLGRGVRAAPAAEDDLTRARELLAEAESRVETDPPAAADGIEEASRLARRASRAAQENLPWSQAPPSFAEQVWAREQREWRESDGGEGILAWLTGPD